MRQTIEHVPAVLDASFWINAVRSGISPYLPDYFALAAPPRVADEITTVSGRPHPGESATLFRVWQESGLIRIVPPRRVIGRFDPGENEAMALAQEHGWVLLIDNSAPRDWSRGLLALRVVDSPALVVFLYDRERLSYHEATAALSKSQAARRIVRAALILLAETARRKEESIS